MRTFTVTTEGENRLGLRELCQRYVDGQWLVAHMTDEQAAEALLDQFKRTARAELELLEVRCENSDGESTHQAMQDAIRRQLVDVAHQICGRPLHERKVKRQPTGLLSASGRRLPR
jgi:hypothetical protein